MYLLLEKFLIDSKKNPVSMCVRLLKKYKAKYFKIMEKNFVFIIKFSFQFPIELSFQFPE